MLRVVVVLEPELLLVVPVLLDTEPDTGLLLDVEPLPTAAREDAVRLVPNDALEVVAVLFPETEVLDGALPTVAVTRLATVSLREPLYTFLLLPLMIAPWPPPNDGLW